MYYLNIKVFFFVVGTSFDFHVELFYVANQAVLAVTLVIALLPLALVLVWSFFLFKPSSIVFTRCSMVGVKIAAGTILK